MKKILMWLVVIIFMCLVSVIGIACKEEVIPAEDTTEETVEETAEDTTEETVEETAEDTTEETVEEATQKFIYFATPLIQMSPDWDYCHEVFLETIEEYGYDGVVSGPNEINIEEQVSNIELAISQNADAIISDPLDPAAFENVYSKANDANIPIIDVNVNSESQYVISAVLTDYVAMGELVFEKIAEKGNGNANVIVVLTGPELVHMQIMMEAFENAAKDTPGVKIVDQVYDKSQVELATELTIASLTAYPEADFVWCIEGAAPPGVVTAIRELGLEGEVNVIGIDMMENTVKGIDKGEIWASVEQNFKAWGEMPVQLFTDYWEGKEVPRVVDSGSVWWTKDNLEDFFPTHTWIERNW